MQLSEGLLLVGYIPLERGVIGVNYTREVHGHIKAKGPCISLNKNPKAQVSHTSIKQHLCKCYCKSCNRAAVMDDTR